MSQSYKIKEMKIDDESFEVSALGAWEQLSIIGALGEVIGPVLGSYQQSPQAAIASLCMQFKKPEFKDTLKLFAKNTRIKQNGSLMVLDSCFDMYFSSRMDLMLKWLMFCLEVNFGSFLGGLEKIAEFALGLVPKANQA